MSVRMSMKMFVRIREKTLIAPITVCVASSPIDSKDFSSFYPSVSVSAYLFVSLSVYLSVSSVVTASVYLCVCLSVYLSGHPYVCLFVCPSSPVCPYVCLSVCVPVYLSVGLSLSLSVCLSIYSSFCLYACPSIFFCLSVCPSVCFCLSVFHYFCPSPYLIFFLFSVPPIYLSECLVIFVYPCLPFQFLLLPFTTL